MMLFGYDRAKETSNAPGAHGDPYVRMLQTKEEIAKQIGENPTRWIRNCDSFN